MAVRHWQWRVSFFFFFERAAASGAFTSYIYKTRAGASEMEALRGVSLFFWNAPLTVARCHSYIWNFTVFTLLFNNINLIILINNKNWESGHYRDGDTFFISIFFSSFIITILIKQYTCSNFDYSVYSDR
jgi:hypothetical protein